MSGSQFAGAGPTQDRNQEATIYIGNLDERASDALIWELMLQAGPVSSVHLPKDRVAMAHQGFGFCEFHTPEDADYACKIMNQIKLFGKPIRVNMASSDKRQLDVGANLFIGGLDWNVDERQLWDAFSQLGTLVAAPQISRDPATGESKGYGFVSYDSFEAADAAIAALDGQHLGQKTISVQYSFKKGGEPQERHGSQAERLLAAQAKKNNALGPTSTVQYTAPIVPQPLISYGPGGVPVATPLQQPRNPADMYGNPAYAGPVAGLIGGAAPPPPPGFR